MFTKLKLYMRAHRIISAVVVIALAATGYYWYQAAYATVTPTKYIVEAASQGSIISSVSGTGQVQAGTTIDVTPKVTETVTSIPVKVGQHVSQGQLLMQLDSTNEEQAVRADQLSLQNAQLSLDELQQVTTSTLLSDQNAVRQGQTNIVTASTTVAQDYVSGFQDLGGTFANLQTVMTGLQNFVQGNDLNATQNDPDAYVGLMPSYMQAAVLPYKNQVQATYQAAAAAYEKNLVDYHATTQASSTQSLDALFAETYNAANTVSAAVKASKDFLTYIVNSYPVSSSTKPLPAITNTLQNNFDTYTNTVTTAVSGVQSTITGITNDKNTLANNEASLEQASETLAELVAGPTQTQTLSAQISVQSAQNNLTTAQQNLANTSVRAPIAGVISAIGATVGETPGSNAITIVGDGEVAEVTLNEIDAAKVEVGDPATLTFDAINGLSLAGTVVEIDPVGTVSQGVVSYNVQVGFSQSADTTSSMQVKPGMSVTANIVTQTAQNVITVPNAAVTTVSGTSYVTEPATQLSAADLAAAASGTELPQGTKRVSVTVGISNDTMTEITSGLSVGDQVVTQTIKGSSSKTTASASSGSAFQLLGRGRGPSGGGG